MKTYTVVCLALALAGCGGDRGGNPPGPPPRPIDQGVFGTVEFWEGDFMPTVYPQVPGGSVTPVARTVYIFDRTTDADVVADTLGGFFTEIHTTLIKTTQSSANGYFFAELPVGTYSLFVGEDGRYYANRWSDGYIQPVSVEAGQLAEVEITIDYLAAY